MVPIPQSFLDSVVAIGTDDEHKRLEWIATGFVVGHRVSGRAHSEPAGYRFWLVTNKHVFEGLSKIYLKFNSATDQGSTHYPVELIKGNGNVRWVGHHNPDVDVAVIFLSAGYLKSQRRKFGYIRCDKDLMTLNQLRKNNVTEGNQVFVLGFPMNLVNPVRQYVICRGGVIARVRDYLERITSTFLVDGIVFPGSSGSPVILSPTARTVGGMRRGNKARLIGIALGGKVYYVSAPSIKTGRPAVRVEVHMGLTEVEPVDAIVETIELAEKRFHDRIAERRDEIDRRVGAEDLERTLPPPIALGRVSSRVNRLTGEKKSAPVPRKRKKR